MKGYTASLDTVQEEIWCPHELIQYYIIWTLLPSFRVANCRSKTQTKCDRGVGTKRDVGRITYTIVGPGKR